MQITIVKIGNIETVPGNPRPYKRVEVLYRNTKGDVYPKKLVSFKNPTVFKVMSEAQPDQIYEVDVVKSEEGYSDWKSANLVGDQQGDLPAVNAKGEGVKAPVKMTVTEGDRNRYIVRQSSLERAVEVLSCQVTPVTFEEVIELAGRFEAWVFRPQAGEAGAVRAEAVAATPVITTSQNVPVARGPGRPRKPAQPVVNDTTEFEVE